jgi:hypothetical protein
MTRTSTTLFASSLVACFLAACASDDSRSVRTFHLDDRDRDGLLEAENGGPTVSSDAVDCPVLEWKEISEETCGEQPEYPVWTCEELPTPPGVNQSCWRCTDETGAVVDEGCIDLPAPCESDAECPDGERCVFYGAFDMGGDADTAGYCEPDYPEVYCEELPGDPGYSCWRCTDETGTVIDEGCYELPRECEIDADCREGEQCTIYGWDGGEGPVDRDGDGVLDPGAPIDPTEPGGSIGYCEPHYPLVTCEEVPGTPEQSCWRCTDEAGNVVEDYCYDLPRSCTSDAECADGEVCHLYDVAICGDGTGDPLPPEQYGTCGPAEPPRPL